LGNEVLMALIIIIIIIIIIIMRVECKNKGDSINNRRDWDHFKVI